MAEQTTGQQKAGPDNGRRQGQSQDGGETQGGGGGGRALARSARRGAGPALARSGYAPSLFNMGPLSLLSMNPFSLMRQFSDEMDEMFSTLVGAEGRSERQGALARMGAFVPQIEVMERDDHLVVRADLPGIAADDVRIMLQDDSLIIEGERRTEHEETRRGLFRSERSYGMFRRVIPLPAEAREENATARFENGVLEIDIPLDRQRPQGRRIEIGGQSPRQGGAGGGGAQAAGAQRTQAAGTQQQPGTAPGTPPPK